MNRLLHMAAYGLITLTLFCGGCITTEHRDAVAASHDEARRADFERCRAAGRTDCDTILNEPVDSNANRGDSVRERERRAAYDRCVSEAGHDCDDLLRH
jgi:hypothetical protein